MAILRPVRPAATTAWRRVLPGAAAGLALLTAPGGAQERCAPEPVEPWPACSAAMMARAINPPFTYEGIGDINLEAFADGANAELLPGRARLQISHGPGGVAGAGAACAAHMGAVAAPGQDAGFSPAMAARIERYTGESVDSTDNAHTVFQVFSPNLNAWRAGAIGAPLEVRHGGVGGWPANAAANVLIELTGTPPSQLEAGERYAARAYVSGQGAAATGGGFLTAWRGATGRVSDPMEPAQRRACEQGLQAFRAQLRALGVPFDDTMGRQVQSFECESRLRLVDGVSRRVAGGALQGHVEIEAITANRVVGTFDLSGQASVAVTVHEPDKADDTETRGGAMTITGRFMAPNVRSGAMAGPGIRAARVDGDDPAPGEGFTVTAASPAPDRRNVSWTPGIRLDFSEPVDPTSLDDTAVRLEYRNDDGAMETVPASLAAAEPDQVAVVPQERLLDGVRYRITAPAGGVRSASGAALSSAFTSDFYTIVDLNDDESMYYAPPGSSAGFHPHAHFVEDYEEGVEANIYQVAANAPLIAGKPTAARVYLKWRPQAGVHEDWVVDEFRTHVRGVGDQDEPLFDEERAVRVRRLDLYDEEDIRAARNTVNLYGWTPRDIDETFEIRIEVEPADQCGEPEVFVETVDVEWSSLQAELDIAYYIARVGPWRHRVPPWAMNETRRIARSAADFTTQSFPVTDTNIRYAGVMQYSDEDHELFEAELTPDAQGEVNAGGVRNYLMETTHDRLAQARQTDADVWLLFTPHSWLEVGGKAEWDLGSDFDARHTLDRDIRFSFPVVQMTVTEGMGGEPLTSAMMLVTHELGHIYGLRHRPYAANDAERTQVCDTWAGELYPGIEGLRIELDGYPGFNKSSTEGNAQSGEQLLPLMHPCGGASEEYWIMDDNYQTLIDNMTELGGARRPSPP